jgi:hypothetical protein
LAGAIEGVMMRLASLLLAATLLSGLAATQAAEQRRVLVLLNDPALEQSHSTFLKSLESRGYQVTIKPITDKALQLKSWDDWLFDKLIIFGSNNGELPAPAVTDKQPGRPQFVAGGSSPCATATAQLVAHQRFMPGALPASPACVVHSPQSWAAPLTWARWLSLWTRGAMCCWPWTPGRARSCESWLRSWAST